MRIYLTFGCIVKISNVRSVVNRCSRSFTGKGVDEPAVKFASTEEALVSCEAILLQKL